MTTIELDVRGLEAPQPLERVLETLDRLGTDDRLLVKINCRPIPLFRILERNGYAYDERPGADSLLEIIIRRGTST
jgi:TusA-related sulfurtransferase